jgi:basic membrane protein A
LRLRLRPARFTTSRRPFRSGRREGAGSTRPLVCLCGAALAALILASGGSSEARLRVGLVLDVLGRRPHTLGALTVVGLQQVERRLHVRITVLTSTTRYQYASNLAQLASARYDLVIAGGPRLARAVDRVAPRYRGVRFAIVDLPRAALPHRPPNVSGLVFDESQAGYLAGYLAGLVQRSTGARRQIVGAVGSISTPRVDRYLAGFQSGARAADPGVHTLVGYSQSYDDQAKCKELALAQIARGSGVELEAADTCGLGVLAAARDQNAWAIATDLDESRLGPFVLTSALKRFDVAVTKTVELLVAGGLRPGRDVPFDVASGAVQLGPISPRVPAELAARVRNLEARMGTGYTPRIRRTVQPG